MIDLGDSRDIDRLYTAMDASREALAPFRKKRTAMLREFVGSHYSDDGAEFEVLVNLMEMTAESYTIGLAASNPRCRVTTPYRNLWPFAYRWQQALNNFIKEMRFAQTLQGIVLDAFFTMGIAKVFQGSWHSIQLEDDVWADPGKPYLMKVSFDDFGLDMGVKDIRRCRFMWDEYRVSWESVQNNPNFEKKIVKELSPSSKYERGEQESNSISTGSCVDDDEYEPMFDLMDVWLPELEKIAVFPRHHKTRPLQVYDAGPEGGPYPILSFMDVPDNVIPLAPGMNLMGLHLLYQGLLRKQKDQAQRQKTIGLYRPTSVENADRIKNARDGEMVKCTDPKAAVQMSWGGAEQGGIAFGMTVFDLFSRAAGNLEARMGLGPQAQTATQEQLIQVAVSRKEAKMLDRTHSFTARCLEGIGLLMWHDGLLNVPASVEVAPNTNIHVDASWTPQQREGDFWQYNFDVVPYSMVYEPPEAKMAKIERAMNQVGQLLPLLQSMGGDPQEFVKQYAELLQVPELELMFSFNTPLAVERPGPQGESGQPRMPAATTRNYVRRNIPTGGTSQSRSMILQQALLGGGQTTPQQRESVMRPMG